MRRYRKNNPIQDSYQNLKSNAKRRGIEFTISFEYFKKFAIETEYIFGKGRSRNSYTIDRIDPTKGYIEGNIQVLENHENVKKSHAYRRSLKYTKHEGVPYKFWFDPIKKPAPSTSDDGCPF